MKKYVLPVFGDMIIERITPKFAQKEINKWAEKFGMYTALLTYLIKICDYTELLEVLNSNPFKKIIKPKRIAKKSKKQLKFYTSSELRIFLKSLKKDCLKLLRVNQSIYTILSLMLLYFDY